LFAGGPISSPVLDKHGVFLKFYDTWIGGRKYPVHMAGFAFSVQHFMEVKLLVKKLYFIHQISIMHH
jgi:hypothetical protein